MAAPIEETAAASSAPFCGRREICQHGKPPLRMHRSLESLLKGWSRGDLVRRKMSATSSTPTLFFPIFSKETPEASGTVFFYTLRLKSLNSMPHPLPHPSCYSLCVDY